MLCFWFSLLHSTILSSFFFLLHSTVVNCSCSLCKTDWIAVDRAFASKWAYILNGLATLFLVTVVCNNDWFFRLLLHNDDKVNVFLLWPYMFTCEWECVTTEYGADQSVTADFTIDMCVYDDQTCYLSKPRWSCRWGETTSLNCGHQLACCSSVRWYMSMENHGGMILMGENSWFVHQSSLAFLALSHLVPKQEELAKGTMNLALWSIFVHTCKGTFNVP
jgi:hypothetical protein